MPTGLKYMKTRAIDSVGNTNDTVNSCQGYVSSFYMTTHPDPQRRGNFIYPPLISRGCSNSNATYSDHTSPPHYFLPLDDAKELAHNHRQALKLGFYYYIKHQQFGSCIRDDWLRNLTLFESLANSDAASTRV